MKYLLVFVAGFVSDWVWAAYIAYTAERRPFDNQQRVTKGIRAHRVGCSNNVAVGAIGYTHSDGYEEARMMETLAIVTLRDAGLPIDDRGWIVCAY